MLSRHSIVVTGQHAVDALLNHRPELLLEVWVQKNRSSDAFSGQSLRTNSRCDEYAKLLDRTRAHGIAVHTVNAATLSQYDTSHRGLLAFSRPPPSDNFANWFHPNHHGLVLAMEHISDTHNFGACLRSADASGVKAVIYSKKGSAQFSSGVAKTSSGALFRIQLVRSNALHTTLSAMRQAHWHIAGLDATGEYNVFDMPVNNRQVVVVGNEQHGLSDKIKKRCDCLARIPTCGKSTSLNASVAAGSAVLWMGDTLAKRANS